jgi:DNA modification methylase
VIKLINDDCIDVMKDYKDNYFDLAIVDPPYFNGPNKSGYYGKGYSSLGVQRAKYYKDITEWAVPDSLYFESLKRVSKNQIIWGANHFSGVFNSSSPCWIIWDKDNGASSFADAELAYTSFKTAARIYKYMWNGMHQGSLGGDVKKNTTRIHPTQKPVQLYNWLLHNYARPGQKIIDTHLGSASSAIAAHYYGVEFLGIELDKAYYDLAVERFNNETSQETMF